MLDIGLIHRKEYASETGKAETVVIAEAPGRVHFLGEHGEPGAALYLSSAIDRYIQVAVSPRKDNSLRFYAADLGERKRSTLANLKYKREDRWANYIKVAIHVFAEMGSPVKGLNFTIAGDIPQQIGLASSSAMEIAALIALKGFLQVNINDHELVDRLIASKTLFFGPKFSPADYLVSLLAKKDQFLIIDEAKLGIKRIKSPLKKFRLILMDSKVPRIGVEDELKQRQDDLKEGLSLLSNKKDDSSFKDFAANDLVDSLGNLPEEIRRRSMHVVEEIRRVTDAGDLLEGADFSGFSKLIYHSHESLRDLYEVSCPEIDWLVKRAQEQHGVLASRMTGNGFGGCTYTFIRDNAVEEYKSRMEDYERIFGFKPAFYETRFASGARIVSRK